MDLLEAWKKLETEKLEQPVKGSVIPPKRSKHPVQKLKTAYLQTTGFAAVFLLMFIYLFFQFDEPLVKGGLVLVILSYIFFFVINYSMYRKVNIELPVDKSLKTALQHTYHFITDNIKFQERVALFIYPIAATSGFLMGGALGSNNINEMMQEKAVIILLIVLLIILTPICFYITRWLYKVSYGKCLIELKEKIDELERAD
jgi:hypothetical protein